MTDVNEILAKRARDLARPIVTARIDKGESHLVFRVGDEVLGIEARFVRQIIAAQDVAALPGAVRPLIGVTGWRGELLPVFDLRSQAAAPGLSARLIVLGDDATSALYADAVDDLVEIAPGSIHPVTPAIKTVRPYAKGITSDTVIVLDGAELLRTLS